MYTHFSPSPFLSLLSISLYKRNKWVAFHLSNSLALWPSITRDHDAGSFMKSSPSYVSGFNNIYISLAGERRFTLDGVPRPGFLAIREEQLDRNSSPLLLRLEQDREPRLISRSKLRFEFHVFIPAVINPFTFIRYRPFQKSSLSADSIDIISPYYSIHSPP